MRKAVVVFLFLGLFPVQVLAENGAKIFENWCETCHAQHHNMPGTDHIRELYGESRVDLRNSPVINDPYVRQLVRYGRGMMPPFRRTEISNAELDILVAYLVEENAKNK